jgi:protocatechuate 3,4-dioxygenase, alpha subunit
MACKQTPSQTVGPFFSIGFDTLNRADLSAGAGNAERLAIRGRVLDGNGCAVPDAVLEIWQADPHGNFPQPDCSVAADSPCHSGFFGFGRVPTNEQGEFVFTTVKPGVLKESGSHLQAPHLAISVFMRGLLQRLVTRLYFPDEPRNESDPVLALVPAERRSTLIARRTGDGQNSLEWNIYLQGDQETVFFEC